MLRVGALAKVLERISTFQLSFFVGLCGFLVYSCMYAFRKPFAAATFEGIVYLGIDVKVWLIIAQTLGYMASKFYGVKFISELQEGNRAWLIIWLVLISWLALLGFAIFPAPFNILCFLVNGFPLGLIWGIVFHYMEGRRFTEIMGSVLAVSFVFSSGFVKSTGIFLMQNFDISESWMPFCTGALFFPILLISVFLINHTPFPSVEDIQLRTSRIAMAPKERKLFFKEFKFGILLLILVYMMLTTLRDFRDNFVVEIWRDLFIPVGPELLTQTEIPITLFLILIMSSLALIKSNSLALFLNHWIIALGFGITLIATLAFQLEWMDPFTWMIAVGTGIYMAYIPFNSLLFDRLIASFQRLGNVGFLMYLADSFGYLASAGLLFTKQFNLFDSISWLNFYTASIFIFSSVSFILIFVSLFYFYGKHKSHQLSIHYKK